jgi:transcriptional regulator with XRE-family HTH domain
MTKLKPISKLKRARVLADISQAELAKKSGVNIYRIQRAEYRWSELKSDEAKAISKILGVKPGEIIEPRS